MDLRGEFEFGDVESACEDLRERTLGKIPGDFARLVYLASTRDYNSGEYHHAGLAHQFGEAAARKALAVCHQEIFRRLLLRSVAELVEELDTYVRSTRLPVSDVVRSWTRLEPHRVTIPTECSSLAARFFASNVTAALAVLGARRGLLFPNPQSASPRS